MTFVPERDDEGNIVNKVEYTSVYSLKGVGVDKICTKNDITPIDLKVENYDNEAYQKKYLWGGEVFGINIEKGDWAQFQVVDKDGVGVALGLYTQEQFNQMGEVVLKQYIVKRYIHPDFPMNIRAEAPGLIIVGLYLRCIYHSVGEANDPHIFINYDLNNKGSST